MWRVELKIAFFGAFAPNPTSSCEQRKIILENAYKSGTFK